MIELFVEGNQIDINEGFSTMLTMAIDDIKDFGAKNGTFSKTIIIPGTKVNNNLFGNIFEVSSGTTYNPANPNISYNFNAAIGAKAYIFADNIQIFKGVLRMMEIVVDKDRVEYECCVFGELGGFIAKVGNKKLEELDFSAYNHVYNETNISGSWSATAGSGYFYPLIDYGTYSAAKHDWDIKTFRPALFAKEYIDKIFSGAGYSYVSALFNTARFKSVIIPHNQKQLTSSISGTSLSLSISSLKHLLNSGTSNNVIIPWDTKIGSAFTANTPKDKFTYNGLSAVTISLAFTLSGLDFSSTEEFTIQLKKNGSVIASKYFGHAAGTVQYWIWSATQSISLVTNDYLEFWIHSSATLTGSEYFDCSVGTAAASSSATITAPINYGDTVVMNYALPKNILQLDFLSSIVKLFNLYLFEDYTDENILKIEPFIDFYANASSVDWSDKIDRSQPMRIKPMSELNSRYFEFNFKDDSDYYNDLYKKRYNESYGSNKYDSQFEFAHESEKVDVIFSGTPIVGYVGEDKVYSTIFKRTGDTIGTGEETIDSNIRLLLSKQVTGVTSWALKNGATTLASYSNYGWGGHLNDPDAPANDLQFGVPKELFFTLVSGALNVNQFNVYWSSYMAEITDKDSRLLTATVKLRYKDIYQLDFSKLVWVDGNLYRINKITDFNATVEDTCKIELLKIINRIY